MKQANYDIFHGDADGLCSLRQLRLVTPLCATLISGPKRHLSLLEHVPAQEGDHVTVLDLAWDRNRDAVIGMLNRGVHVEYFDHHACGDVPSHPLLHAVLDSSPNVCTGILVDRFAQGRYREWAVVAAFGDNLTDAAAQIGSEIGLPERQLKKLQFLGEFLNYNAYGETGCDLIVQPAELYRILCHYADPADALDQEPLIHHIAAMRGHDFDHAWQQAPYSCSAAGRIYVLPDRAWSRRVRGSFANEIANRWPDVPIAVLVETGQDDFVVSVRAPKSSLNGADILCSHFAGGGGRPAAAGINRLPRAKLEQFVDSFRAHTWR